MVSDPDFHGRNVPVPLFSGWPYFIPMDVGNTIGKRGVFATVATLGEPMCYWAWVFKTNKVVRFGGGQIGNIEE
ncbi:MAG: hypothetical protein CR994_00880 [Maribacter sp.]|nr:MAG: hypothetical protein CR994_00880 [Maribacter sp.]